MYIHLEDVQLSFFQDIKWVQGKYQECLRKQKLRLKNLFVSPFEKNIAHLEMFYYWLDGLLGIKTAHIRGERFEVYAAKMPLSGPFTLSAWDHTSRGEWIGGTGWGIRSNESDEATRLKMFRIAGIEFYSMM
jgi:hypothetical protein